jgi:AraC-like DNA-binding protein
MTLRIEDSEAFAGICQFAVSPARYDTQFTLKVMDVGLPQGPVEVTYERPVVVLPIRKNGTVFHLRHAIRRVQHFVPGQLGVFPAGFVHACEPELGASFCELAIRDEYICRKAAELDISTDGRPAPEFVPTLAVEDRRLCQLVWALIHETLDNGLVDRVYAELLVDGVIARLLGSYCASAWPPYAPAGTQGTRLRRALDFLHDRLADPSWGLNDWAQAVGVSSFHLARTFRQATGRSPHQYLLAQRVSLAGYYLWTSDLSITQIALASGFGGSAHFSTAFRRLTGHTPSEYRRRRR